MSGFLNAILAAGGDRDFNIFLSVVIVALAILVIAIVLNNRRPSGKNLPPAPPPVVLPKPEEAPPDHVAIVYSGLNGRTVFFCPSCDCEYPASRATCEICGKSLQRRNINDM